MDDEHRTHWNPDDVDWDSVTIHDRSPITRAQHASDLVTLALFVIAVLLWLAVPVTLLSLIGDWNRWPWAAATLTGAIGTTMAAAALITLTDRSQDRTVLGSSLGDLPPELRDPMARIVLAIEAIRAERSVTDGFLGELDLAQTAWQAAQTALRGGELATARTAILDSHHTDDIAATARAQQLLDIVVADLTLTAQRLCTAAEAAAALSAQLADTDARQRAEQARDAVTAQQIQRRVHLEEVINQVESSLPDTTTDIADTVTARANAYTEVIRLSNPLAEQ